MLHVKKEDQVRILTGRDRGKEGRVLRVFPKQRRAIVEHVNLIKRHTRPVPQRNIQGGVVEREAPIELSNLQVICGECAKPTRVGLSLLADGTKVRVCKKCGGTIGR
ncbi:MAG: 50S ribosomal protein L24 [Acidobacteriota bacterium]